MGLEHETDTFVTCGDELVGVVDDGKVEDAHVVSDADKQLLPCTGVPLVDLAIHGGADEERGVWYEVHLGDGVVELDAVSFSPRLCVEEDERAGHQSDGHERQGVAPGDGLDGPVQLVLVFLEFDDSESTEERAAGDVYNGERAFVGANSKDV